MIKDAQQIAHRDATRMTLRQMRYFLALCEERNFTRAARRCGVRQPSLTRAIKELEAELGGALFERNGKITRLTRLGVAVRPHFATAELAAARAEREATTFLAARAAWPAGPAPMQPFDANLTTRETLMRKAVFSVAVAFMLCLLGIISLRPYRSADASPPPQADATLDIRALQSAMDVSALPRQEIPPEGE